MVDDGMDVDVVIDGEVDGTIVVTIEVDNVEDLIKQRLISTYKYNTFTDDGVVFSFLQDWNCYCS